jgi:hypothetical protein
MHGLGPISRIGDGPTDHDSEESNRLFLAVIGDGTVLTHVVIDDLQPGWRHVSRGRHWRCAGAREPALHPSKPDLPSLTGEPDLCL